MNRLVLFLICFVGAAFFVGAAYWLYQTWQPRVRLGLDSRDWPTAPATFQSGYVDFEDGIANQNERANYEPVISYVYSVDGIGHYNDVRAATTIGYASREEAEAFIASYPKEGLLAHYNPEDPTVCVLEPGISVGYRMLVILPITLVLVGLLILWVGLRALITGKT